MAYCTLDDIKKVIPEQTLIELTDDDGLEDIDQAKINEAIAGADGEIDTYLSGSYSVPLSTVPAIIKRCSQDIAIYHLYKRRQEDVSETRRIAYKDAIRTLERISDGKIKLPISGASGDFATGVLTSSHFGDD